MAAGEHKQLRRKLARSAKNQRAAVEDRLKLRPPRLPKSTSYVIEISGWDWRYSFGVERSGLLDQSMIEYCAFSLNGMLAEPPGGIRTAKAMIIPDRRLDQVHSLSRQSVGVLRLNRTGLEAFLSMPSASVGPILQMMLASKFTQLSIDATPFKLNEADVMSFAFRSQNKR